MILEGKVLHKNLLIFTNSDYYRLNLTRLKDLPFTLKRKGAILKL